MGTTGSSLVTWMRPVIRLLRRKTVLALIFCLSFAYCMTSLYYGNHYRSTANMMGVGSIRGAIMSDYDAENGHNIPFRRGGGGGGGVHGKNGDPAAMGMIPMLSPDAHDRRVMQKDLIDYESGGPTDHLVPVIPDSEVNYPKSSCRNSVQGKVLISDDQGYICQRKDLISRTGCCDTLTSSNKRYSCDLCDSGNNCCSIYEYCISCCMHPRHKDLLSAVLQGDNSVNNPAPRSPVSRVFYASLTDQFDYCLARCRTSSHSVQHENSYRDPKAKHCFGAIDPPPAASSPATT